MVEECHQIPFRIFVDYVTIFNSSPMQHLRWSSFWQKSNDWKLLLTFVTENFIINIAGLLDLTLKCINKFTLFNVSKKDTRTVCQIYSKLTVETPERHLVLLLLTLNIFCALFYHWYCWIWTNKCHLGLRNGSFRQWIYFQQLWEGYCPMGQENLLGYVFSSLFAQHKLLKG